ncbi:hypothetical protein GVN20_25675 [Runella sp. CRIBMP]|uniref:hypothetical protein n=1 Tax=Runella sp. CRIBMP TaxID=2683261 RepID=UPI0014131962|nr:hypothetical protein [Runella sp. CRIBMP]NBB22771.1 hypothetical protein [Runella sp. CRIBMP]
MKTWKEAVSQLDEVEPRATAWEELSARLAFEDQLVEQVNSLLELEPNDDLWGRIEPQLDVVKPLWYQRWPSWAAAAAVIFTVGLGIWWNGQPTQKVTIAYSTELVADWESTDVEINQPREVEAFIAESCQRKSAICTTPDFRDLKGELQELNSQKARIEHEIKMFGEQPDLVKAQIKIENQRAEITKELVQKLMI